MKTPKPALIALALLSGCFALAVTIEPKLAYTEPFERHDRRPVEVIFGDARRFFASHFMTKADVYFHSGYYPSIFEQAAAKAESHLTSGVRASISEPGHEEKEFLGQPLDWIDRFGRAFFPSTHTHLDDAGPHQGHAHGPECNHDHEPQAEKATSGGKVREMLPWLRITAELDPNRIETYTVGSFWLRTRMKNPEQAEAFLREGLRANPGSYAILFELGRIYDENHHDTERARNLWEAALKNWNKSEAIKSEPDTFQLSQIAWHLALLEQKGGNLEKAIACLKIAQKTSPNADEVQKRIDEIAALQKVR